MIIAEEKRKSNIAEYILYMWQVEDIIRACNFSIDMIESNYISKFNAGSRIMEEIKNWYANLILMMHEEGIREKGHLSFLDDVVAKMNELHMQLLNSREEAKYQTLYTNAVINLREFKSKLPTANISDIEACLNALYGLLLLRLNKKNINKETEDAMATFSNLLSYLAVKYQRIIQGQE